MLIFINKFFELKIIEKIKSMSVIPQTEAVKKGLKLLSSNLQEKTDTFRKVNDEKRIKTQDEIKKYLTGEDIFLLSEELKSMNSKISLKTIAAVLNITSDTFNRMFKSGKNIVLKISDSKKIEEFKNNLKDKKSAEQEKEPKEPKEPKKEQKETKEKETSLLEAIKNLDEKITFLSQEVASLKKKKEEEYEYKDNEDNEEEGSLDEELDGFPKGNFLFGSRVNYEIYNLFMGIIEKKDLKIQRGMNEAMLLFIKKYQE